MRTALNDKHRALGAKIVDFAGWEMPVQYQSIINEHNCVRKAVGLFDVSHMGRISIFGKEAAHLLDFLSTNHIFDKKPLTATYTVMCDSEGYCVDDTLIYRVDDQHFFMVANAGNRQKDLEHLQKQACNFDVQITPHFQGEGILALQGPSAFEVMKRLIPEAAALKPMTFCTHQTLIIARSGYTGEDGFECYGPDAAIVQLWDQFLEAGKSFGIMPVGLGARDTLRLEKGFALYGHEISGTIAPTESVAAWTVKWDKSEFLGKEALLHLEKSVEKRHEFAFVLTERGIPREGCEVYREGRVIGKITSGTFSPSLEKGIALFITSQKCSPGDILEVKVRDHLLKAEVVSLPFVKSVKQG